MIYNKKGFTIFELMIVIALIGIFFTMTSYMSQDVRVYQSKAERFANAIYDMIRMARNNMIIGRGVLSGSTLVVTTKRVIDISSNGVFTNYTYGTTSTGSETKLVFPFLDADPLYKINDISVSSGGLIAGGVPLWDHTGAMSAAITISPNSDIVITGTSSTNTSISSSTIRTLKVTAGYNGFEESVVIDRVTGTVETRTSSQD